MSEHVKEIGDDLFQEAVKSGLVLVDFWATWCGPCQMMAPVLDKVAAASPHAKFYKIDVDNNNVAAGSLGVQSIPTFVLFKNGVEVDRMIGAHQEAELVALLAKHK